MGTEMNKTKIEKAAVEWAKELKVSGSLAESATPSEYAGAGYVMGANRIITHLIEMANKLEELKSEYEQRYLKHGKQLHLDAANNCTAILECLNGIIQFHTVTE